MSQFKIITISTFNGKFDLFWRVVKRKRKKNKPRSYLLLKTFNDCFDRRRPGPFIVFRAGLVLYFKRFHFPVNEKSN